MTDTTTTTETQVETFSQQIINKANKTVKITDDLGRVITLRKPKFSSYLNLLKALGPDLSNNKTYVDTVGIVSSVVDIDGKPQPIKQLVDIDFLVGILERSDDALAKIAEAVIENFSDVKTLEEHNLSVKK